MAFEQAVVAHMPTQNYVPREKQITKTPQARKQLLALMMASHNRCGAASPARHFVSLPQLATAPLWDWCLHDSEIVLGAAVVLPNSVGYFTFGISSALGSVSRGIRSYSTWRISQVRGCSVLTSFLPHCLVVTEVGNTRSLMSLNLATRQRRLLATEDKYRKKITGSAGNHKWWLRCNGDGVLTVVRMTGVDVSNVHCGGIFCPDDGTQCVFICFNKSLPDEAAILVVPPYGRNSPVILVIDVNQTYSSKNLTVLSSTTLMCNTVQASSITSGISMMKFNGQRVFFVEAGFSDKGKYVHEINESGTIQRISQNTKELAQLSYSLFCISKGDDPTIEIWDCNNTAAPMRVLPESHFVIAESGFLFHNHCKIIDVTDSTGFRVATLTFARDVSAIFANAIL
ncbi:hypothetical protein Pelo_6008 [Pelomyxa schiedti]|nr:hypothetical protein Pelo_6008 [Pelomyxa schiedti]